MENKVIMCRGRKETATDGCKSKAGVIQRRQREAPQFHNCVGYQVPVCKPEHLHWKGC